MHLHRSEQGCLCTHSHLYVRSLCCSAGVWEVCCCCNNNRVFVFHGCLQCGQHCRIGSSRSAAIGAEPTVRRGNRDPSHPNWSQKSPATAAFREQQGTCSCKDAAKPLSVWFTKAQLPAHSASFSEERQRDVNCWQHNSAKLSRDQ